MTDPRLRYAAVGNMAKFMTAAAEAGFRGAIQVIEAQSSAEVMIAVRPWLRRWLLPHIVIGAVAIVAGLAFLLFSEDLEFELWSIAVIPLLAAVAGGLLV